MELVNKVRDNKSKIIWVILIGCIIGLATHSYCFFNKLSYHDDVYSLFSVGATFEFGRWGLGVLWQIIQRITSGCFSIPSLNGMTSVALLAVASALICVMFEIENRVVEICIVGIIEVFPAVTATYAYMFTAPYYMLAILFAVIAVFLCQNSPCWRKYTWIAVFMLAFSVGIYQAYFEVAVSLFLMDIIARFWKKEKLSDIFKRAVYYVTVMILAMIAYFVINKIFTSILQIGLSDYAGINNMLNVSGKGIVNSILSSYVAFGMLMVNNYVGLSFLPVSKVLLIVMWGITLFELVYFSVKRIHGMLDRLIYWGAVLLLPLAFHIVNVMVSGGNAELHTLMVFGAVFEILFPIIAISYLSKNNIMKNTFLVAGIILFSSFVVIDNQAYLRADLLQKEATAYYNRLLVRVQETEKYQSTMPIFYTGTLGKDDATLTKMDQFSHITMTGFNMTLEDLVNDYSRGRYMEYFLGCNVEMTEISEDDIIWDGMESYPDANSIKVENGAVWIKFSE